MAWGSIPAKNQKTKNTLNVNSNLSGKYKILQKKKQQMREKYYHLTI